ncbi:hypothetical protein NNJEOMEG_03959 [Fundidesulfovibrio magnetotacticus]|uniref:Transposase n=1 Tax=Fundidesulfovibrio magnetotacticus TaxID=2730080 RepID=A0A6V8M642_9BACT|nr:hypothetical protein [Fundidesulfovibrio magnetotacticus]GFK96085.1 hypothetical protein NNJEOMEG_03959 [Fundidesulfovibrio magnetotacticus]
MIRPPRDRARPLHHKNRYAAYAKIDEPLLQGLARHFSQGDTASQAALALCVNRNTANRYYRLFRDALTREACEGLRVVPETRVLVGLFLGAIHVEARLVPVSLAGPALEALRGERQALEACSLSEWPGYDALGEPATGAFALMPCCLVGPLGQSRLASRWRLLRERLCKSRGIPREDYWRHLAVCELAGELGTEGLRARLLDLLKPAA